MFPNSTLRTLAALLVAAVPTLLHPGAASAAPVPTEAAFVPGEVLVAFREDAGFFRREALVENLGARVVAVRPTLGYQKIELPAGRTVESAVRSLASDPDVAWAEPNWIYHAAALPIPQDEYLRIAPAATPNQWGVLATGLATMWQQGGGDPSVVIAIVDSGVDDFASPHADIAANVLNGAMQGRDFIDGDYVPNDAGALPGYGHGTAAAGVAAAAADGSGIAGMAYDSRLAFVRVLDCTVPGCTGTNDQIAQGIAWAADSASADVINLSLAGPAYAQAMRNAILHAIGKDAIVVAASGNDSTLTLPYPANYPEVITVGATNAAGGVPTFSNSGANLDVVAPGVDIWTLKGGGGHSKWSGTSFAAPLVSGVAALLRARNPSITQLETKKWLTEHTVDTSDPARDGAGEVHYQIPADFSDAEAYAVAGHDNALWEWLGERVSHEISEADGNDTDGIRNIDVANAQSADLGDDAVFPINLGKPPFAPTRWAPAKSLDIPLTVSNHLGPRYGATADSMLHLDQWVDWNGDGVFGADSLEHTIIDHTEDPGTWGAGTKTVTKALRVHKEHILGLPLTIRTRVGYGAAHSPDGVVSFGEVEDLQFDNLVEDFDLGFYSAGGPFLDMGTWFPTVDPDPMFSNHGMWHMAKAFHPAPGTACNGFVDALEIMKSPPMLWFEYTDAAVTFVYSHESQPCGPVSIEACRLEVLMDGAPAASFPIPLGSGTLVVPLTAYTGTPAVIELRWIVDTDNQGHMFIDDIRVVALDGEMPEAITDLGIARTAGERDVTVSFTAPHENKVSAPAKEGVPSAYRFRYSTSPILDDFDFDEATPILPREVTGGALPMPGVPGAGQAFTFHAPCAFDPYYVAVKTADEVVHMGGLSNVPSVTNTPT
ncbi:S8 family serine peptidase, partial [bacterium]|nr:S8 family serine peptidase [bacterium]